MFVLHYFSHYCCCFFFFPIPAFHISFSLPPSSLMDLMLLKSARQLFYWSPSTGGMRDVSSWWDWGYAVWGMIHKRVPCSMHHIRGTWFLYVLLVMLMLITWQRWYLSGFSTINTLFFLLQLLNIWGEILWAYANILFVLKLLPPDFFFSIVVY